MSAMRIATWNVNSVRVRRARMLAWLEKHLHPHGLACPRCGATERRVARRKGPFLGYRCLACDRYLAQCLAVKE